MHPILAPDRRIARRHLLQAGVGAVALPALGGIARAASGDEDRSAIDARIRLILKSITIRQGDNPECLVECRLENQSDEELTFQLNHWDTAFEFGLRLWRVQSDEVYAFAPNYPPGIPATPPPTILKADQGVDFQIRPLLEAPGFRRRQSAKAFDYSKPLRLAAGATYAIDSSARVSASVAGRKARDFFVTSWNKLWYTT